MADTQEKINIIDLEIDQDKALQDLTELQKEIVDTKNEIKALQQQQKQLEDQGKSNSAQYQKNAKSIEANKVQVKNLNKEYSAQQKVVADVLQTEQRELGTIEKLTLSNKELRQELRELNLETEEGQKRQKEIVQQIDENTEIIKENSDSFIQAKMNVGNYTESIEQSIPALRGVFGGLKQVTAASKAFLATPLGLILAAAAAGIALLIKGFQRSQALADKMKVANSGLRASFDVIIDRVSNGMEKAFKKLREDPLQAVKDLGKGIVDNLVNRVKALPQIFIKAFEAVKYAIKGNSDEAKKSLEELGQAFIQLETGLDPEQQKKVADAAKSVKEEMAAEAKVARQLAQAEIDLQDLEIKLIGTKAELTKKREEAKLATRDETLSIEERLAAQDRAIELDKQLLQVELNAAKERARISQQRIDLGKSTRDDLRENAEAQAEVTRLESEYFTRSKELYSERISLSNQLKAEEAARAEEVKQKLLEEAQAMEAYVNNEIEIWKLRNKTAVDSSTELTDELVQGEKDRLDTLEKMRIEAIEKSFENELISEQEKQLRILQIQEETNQQKLKLEEDFQKEKAEMQEDQAAQLFELQRLELERQIGSEYELRRQSLEKWYNEQVELAKGNQEILTQLDRTYSAIRKEIAQAERDARIEGFAGIFRNLQTLFEENTVAYKASSTALIAADTYKAAMGAYAAMAAIPVVGPGLGVIAAGAATAAGLKAIRDVWAINPKSGVQGVNQPAGGGRAAIAAYFERPNVANVSASGGLVERDLEGAAAGGEVRTKTEYVLISDQVTADQKNTEEIKTLSSV